MRNEIDIIVKDLKKKKNNDFQDDLVSVYEKHQNEFIKFVKLRNSNDYSFTPINYGNMYNSDYLVQQETLDKTARNDFIDRVILDFEHLKNNYFN